MQIRNAVPGDIPQILVFIKHLADYEKLSHEVVATEEQLEETLFGDKAYAEVLIAETDDNNQLGLLCFFIAILPFWQNRGFI